MDDKALRHAAHLRALADAVDTFARGDRTGALTRLDTLHEAAHDDPSVHRAVHVWTMRIRIEERNYGGALGEVLPIVFAPLVARFEQVTGRRNGLFGRRGGEA